jgi:hypothetical protein
MIIDIVTNDEEDVFSADHDEMDWISLQIWNQAGDLRPQIMAPK